MGLGRRGRRIFEENAEVLAKRIKSAFKGADRATREVLLKQLSEETFDIFMCVADRSQVGDDVIRALRQAFPKAGKIDVLTYGSLLAPK